MLEKAQQQNLSSANAADAIHPVALKTEKWLTIEKPNKERELVGSFASSPHWMSIASYPNMCTINAVP